jgi:peptide/nickel transport system substrate-binding protein
LPGLAESWKVVGDTVWEFKLRQNVKWHDGSPFTADDVIFTFQRAPNVPNSPSSFAGGVKGKTVTKVDDHTIRISTEAVAPTLPNDVATIMIVSKKHGEGAKTEDYNSGKAAIGTGPYKFTKFTPGDRIEFERNDAYWGAKPKWTKLLFKPIPAGPARVAALLAGDVDMIEDTPTADIERLKKDPKVQLSQGISNRLIYLFVDHARDVTPFAKAKDGAETKNPFKDKRVRQAVAYAIDMGAVLRPLMGELFIPAGMLIAPGVNGYAPELDQPLPYDPDRAKKLLAEAGYPDGFSITLDCPSERGDDETMACQGAAEQLGAVGIDVEINFLPTDQLISQVVQRRASDFFLFDWYSEPDSQGLLEQLFQSRSNLADYANPQIDELIEKIQTEMVTYARDAYLEEAWKIVTDDLVYLPIRHGVSVFAMRKELDIPPDPWEVPRFRLAQFKEEAKPAQQ